MSSGVRTTRVAPGSGTGPEDSGPFREDPVNVVPAMRPNVRVILAAAMILAGGSGLYRLGPGRAAGQGQRQDPLAEPFRGVTTDGTVVPGLFPIRATGVSTAPMREAADRFLAALTPEQRGKTTFPVDDIEWRSWNNVHRYDRRGVSFREMSEAQRAVAFDLLRASLSVRGFETSRDIMRLNGTIAEIRDNRDEYGDDLYNLTVMGEPSATSRGAGSSTAII